MYLPNCIHTSNVKIDKRQAILDDMLKFISVKIVLCIRSSFSNFTDYKYSKPLSFNSWTIFQ